MNKDTLGVLDILNKWVEYSEYDPNQKSFILGSTNYYMNKASKLASKILEEYDKTGNLSAIMLRESFLNILDGEKISVLKLLKNSNMLDKTREMYEMFNSEVVSRAYDNFNSTVHSMYKEVIGIDLIGDIKENYASWIESIVDNIEHLGIDVYKKGNTPLKIDKFYKNLLVFDSLGEATLYLEKVKDGVYTCYINVAYTSDSYFGFFIKSNDNLVGLTDRINEKYPGQHARLNQRNGRWAEDKCDVIFPYDTILSYDDYCSKGYALKFKLRPEFERKESDSIKTNEIAFKDLESNNGYDGIVLGMIVLKMKYDGYEVIGDEVYMSSLINQNSCVLLDKNELMTVGSSELLIRNRDVRIEFSNEQILGDSVPYKEFKNDDIVRIYGKGFVPDYSEIYSQDNIKRLVDKKYSEDIIPEYIGNRERLEKGAYYIIRKQLALYIELNIEKEWIRDGGLKAYKDWYINSVKENMSNVLALCMDEVVKSEKIDTENRIYINTLDFAITFIFGERYARDTYLDMSSYLNERNDSDSFICPITGVGSSIFFVIEPRTLKGIGILTGKKYEDIPNMIRLSKANFNRGGNSLLDMCDPIGLIKIPFGDNRINGEYTRYSFRVGLGISKRAFKKIRSVIKSS